MNREWEDSDYPDVAAFIRDAVRRVGPESGGVLIGVGASATTPPKPLLLANVQRVQVPKDSRLKRPEPRETPGLYPLSGPLREQLGVYDAPDQTVVMVVEPPEPMGALNRLAFLPGKAIRCSMRGTLGPSVATAAGRRSLTAGHVAGPAGTEVQRIVKRLLSPTKYPRIGQVERSIQPVAGGQPGYDVGVLELDNGSGAPCRVARLNPFQASPVPGTLNGGVSGRGYGLLIGSLAGYGDPDGRFAWTNSWIMTPGEIGAEGDSGGSVTLAGDEVLGILVAGCRVKGSKNFAQLYVQDLESIERDVLTDTQSGG